jgi:predicted XRE-type DNA-binding protein
MDENEQQEYTIGSGNVFADLALSEADELLTRAQLGHAVRLLLEERALKQREAAELLEISQAEVSKLMNGKYYLFSESRLFGFLNRLDRAITIHVTPHHQGERWQDVVVL